MTELNLDEPLEIAQGEFKRLGDCTGPEIEAAIRLIARGRIDRAWTQERAAGGSPDGRVIARRFFADSTEFERNLMAYWQLVRLIEEESLLDDCG